MLEPDLERLHGLIDDYLDHRYDADPNATDTLVAAIEGEGATIEEVEALLRAGRSSYPDVTSTVGQLTERLITCDHVNYSSGYLLAVPSTYRPDVATPLVFVTYPVADAPRYEEAHASAQAGMSAYRDALTQAGAIVVAPITTRGWSPIAESLMISIISDLQRRYHIDPDAISIVGRSTGGHMAWRAAYTLTDRWSAFAPINGGYDTYVLDNRLRNVFGTYGFQGWSNYVSTALRDINADIAAVTSGYGWTTRYFESGSAEVPGPLVSEIAAFLVGKRRDTTPSSVYLYGGSVWRYSNNWPNQTETIYFDRAYRWNSKHWLEITPSTNPALIHDISATVLDGQTIIITANNIRQVRLHLHPDMGIDFAKPLQVFANDVLRYDGLVPRDIGQMLEYVREWDDRGRVYHGVIDVTIPTDREVPAPFGVP